MKSEDKLVFLENFDNIFEKYEIARNALAFTLPKTIDEYSKFHLAPLNEFRNALFHIFKSFDENSDIEYEHKAAIVHYTRAQYDAFELYIDAKVRYINNVFTKFDSELVNKVFSRYYTGILPEVNKLKYSLTAERTQRRKDTEKATELIFDKYLVVDKYVTEIKVMLGVISDEQEFQDRRNKRFLTWGVLWAILIGIVVGFIGAFFNEIY